MIAHKFGADKSSAIFFFWMKHITKPTKTINLLSQQRNTYVDNNNKNTVTVFRIIYWLPSIEECARDAAVVTIKHHAST